ncbi:MAG: nucleotide exchange factor GrpE [Clostridiales bacterium]|nr:nucleotide exchange factor GrpE [Clostridiales bacterium]
MQENKERMCDAQECKEDCSHCEHAGENNGINLDNLSIDDLKELFRSQKILVDALVAENESLMKQQEELNKKIEKGNEYLDQLVMLKRDFENYKRRTQNNQDDAKKQGKVEIVEKILPILDTFARAEESLKGQKEYDSFKMVSRQMEKILSEIGLEEVEVLGNDFDPNLSYAIMKEEAGEENVGKVIDVLSKGYKFNDKIVRYSQVKVGC